MASSRTLARRLLSELIYSPQFTALTVIKPTLPCFFSPFHSSSIIITSTQLLHQNIPSHSHSHHTLKDSQFICKLLSTMPNNSSIQSILDNSGVKEAPPFLVLEVLKSLSNSGLLALAFFRWAENQKGFQYTTDSYNALIDSLGKIKQYNIIWVLVDTMKDKGLLTKYTFNLIARRYARARRVEEAIETFQGMKNKYGMSIDLSDLNRFLDTMCKSRQVKSAHQVFDDMKKRGVLFDKKSYTILLEGWGQKLNLLKLNKVYKEMKDQGFEPDVVAYGILMNAFCKARNVSKAVGLFNEMVAKGVEPSQHIYCILINGLGSDKRLGEALKFFEMSKANGVIPELPTYNAVVGSYCWSTRFDDAFRIVDEMKKLRVGPNSRTYDIILHHLMKAGKVDEAYSVFLKMKNGEGCSPTVSTYEIIIRMFCSNGDLNMAAKVWNEMKGKGVIPGMHMFATLINSYRQANMLEDACMYFEEMIDVGIRPPGSVFSTLKQALIDEGKKDAALLLAKKLDALRVSPITG